MPSPSFAYANFISATATIGTNHKPNSHKAIGVYPEVLFTQGTSQSSYSLVIPTDPTKPDAGTINIFGVRVFKYLNNVSVWWYVLATTTSLAIAPRHQRGKFVFLTLIDGTAVEGVGWSQRASPAYVTVFDASMHMTEETLRGCIWTNRYHRGDPCLCGP
jgi:hypothetical protein